jgi:RNA polymerase sigma-70 factor (ECF subfamily)
MDEVRRVEQVLDRAPEARKEREQAWIDASRRGDARAFNHLVLRWETPIYNLARRMLHDADEASEATQEVFLAAFRNIRRFRGGSKFSSWLYRIAANHCLSRLRRRPSVVPIVWDEDSAVAVSAAGSPETELLLDERRRQVVGALAETDPDQRIVVELKVYHDRTFDEIAEILSIPSSTTKSRFYAGLDTVRRRLERMTARDRRRR